MIPGDYGREIRTQPGRSLLSEGSVEVRRPKRTGRYLGGAVQRRVVRDKAGFIALSQRRLRLWTMGTFDDLGVSAGAVMISAGC